ncbi:MAG: hypothetical protein ABR970_22260, partial [Roseiarcus sp.]
MNAQPVAPVALPPRSRPAQPLVAPRDIAALAGLALAGGDHLCSRPLLLALVDLACAGRTEFGDAADWRALEAAVGRTGLAIDQIFDCLAREAVAPGAPVARKFRIFPFDYESWQAFRQRPDKADSSDEACWFDLCRSATGANPSDGDAAFVAFVRDAVRITRLPIDSVLDAASAAAGGGSGRP